MARDKDEHARNMAQHRAAKKEAQKEEDMTAMQQAVIPAVINL